VDAHAVATQHDLVADDELDRRDGEAVAVDGRGVVLRRATPDAPQPFGTRLRSPKPEHAPVPIPSRRKPCLR